MLGKTLDDSDKWVDNPAGSSRPEDHFFLQELRTFVLQSICAHLHIGQFGKCIANSIIAQLVYVAFFGNLTTMLYLDCCKAFSHSHDN